MTAARRRAATAGEIVAIDDGMVTNAETREPGEAWRAWLFVARLQGEDIASDVIELESATRDGLESAVWHLVRQVGGRTQRLLESWPAGWCLP